MIPRPPQLMPKKKKRATAKPIKEQRRSAILSDIARMFAYYDNVEMAQFHARQVVQKLVEWKLLDPTLPLRPIDTTGKHV